MFRYINPYTNQEIYIALKYVLTIKCAPDERLLTLGTVGDHPDLRLHFATDKEYWAAKASILNHIQRG